MSQNDHPSGSKSDPQQWRDVPIDWEALEDAFENNAPEVHSYLHVPTGDVLRIVDGVADPQMHARIAADTNYLRVEPVSSREQYRWMERYIPMVEDKELQHGLNKAIDGKGAFRRFKDVLMSHGPERERWFAFRSERLRIFMEAWLNAHALNPVKRPVWVPEMAQEQATSETRAETAATGRAKTAEGLRRHVRDAMETLGTRDLEQLAAFAEFLRARRAAGRSSQSGGGQPEAQPEKAAQPVATTEATDDAEEAPSSTRVAKRKAAPD